MKYLLYKHKGYVDEFFLSETCPGTLQYRVQPLRYRTIQLPCKADLTTVDGGFTVCKHTQENLNRVLPYTQKGLYLAENCRVLVMIEHIQEDRHCIKAAIQNTETGLIALMTGLNMKDYSDSRTIKSHDPEYRVCQCRMTAPYSFWYMLAISLLDHF